LLIVREEEDRLRVFETRKLRGVFGPKRKKRTLQFPIYCLFVKLCSGEDTFCSLQLELREGRLLRLSPTSESPVGVLPFVRQGNIDLGKKHFGERT
jgi:hypothetical protein